MDNLAYADDLRPRLLINSTLNGLSSDVKKSVMVVEERRGNAWVRLNTSQEVEAPANQYGGFTLPIYFGRTQLLRFMIYDITEEKEAPRNYPENGYVCKVETDLGAIASQSFVDAKCQDYQGADTGCLLRLEGVIVDGCDRMAFLSFRGVNLPKPSCRSPEDCRFRIMKRKDVQGADSWHTIYTSPIYKTSSPSVENLKVPWGLLYSDTPDPDVRIEVMRFASKRPVCVGFIEGKANTFASTTLNIEYPVKLLSNPNSAQGRIEIKSFQWAPESTFVSLLRNGLRLKFSVCLDFTNCNPHDMHSKHFIGPRGTPRPSPCIRAISNIIEAVSKYAVQDIAAYGYGLSVPVKVGSDDDPRDIHSPKLCPFFPVSLKATEPSYSGIDNFVQGYVNLLSHEYRSGAGNPKMAIEMLSGFAAQDMNEFDAWRTRQAGAPAEEQKEAARAMNYHVAIVVIDEPLETISGLVQPLIDSSHAPISFIFVSLTSGATKLLSKRYVVHDEEPGDDACCCWASASAPPAKATVAADGETALRDNVHYVDYDDSMERGVTALTDAILGKLPEQVVQYCHLRSSNNSQLVAARVKPHKPEDLVDELKR